MFHLLPWGGAVVMRREGGSPSVAMEEGRHQLHSPVEEGRHQHLCSSLDGCCVQNSGALNETFEEEEEEEEEEDGLEEDDEEEEEEDVSNPD